LRRFWEISALPGGLAPGWAIISMTQVAAAIAWYEPEADGALPHFPRKIGKSSS